MTHQGGDLRDGDRELTADANEQVTDAELVARFRRDPEMFIGVYDRYRCDVYRYVAGRLDRQTADDITAETFLVAFGQLGRFNPERGGLRPWLFGIATNMVARHRRKEARHYRALVRIGPDPVVDSHESHVVSSVTAQCMRAQLARALLALSQGERDVVWLVAMSQLSYEEVAQALGISQGTVGSRLSRARRKLRDAIDQEALNG
jgi:RNA polymerase sigma-70 factor, ECF subfamily